MRFAACRDDHLSAGFLIQKANMADEVFALSPISARSASPTDADYEAIREAFMETTRGRWFLGEYAKRNRNADTAMVLEAVTRLEQSVATSRNEAAAAKPPADSAAAASPAPAHDDIIASVKVILERTRVALAAALAMPDMEQALAPFQRSARIIQEIAWGLRESGSDGRICTMLDEQVRAMALACEGFAATEHRDAILHTFDASLVQIEKLADSETASASDEPATPVMTTATMPTATIPAAVMPSAAVPVTDPVPAVALNDLVTDDCQSTENRTAEEHAFADHGHKNLGHEDHSSDEPALPPVEVQSSETKIVAPEKEAGLIEAAPPEPVTPAPVEAPVRSSILPNNVLQDKPAAQPSLGDSLLARGIVASAIPPRDPLAPIRRMSQAEKIAFFS